MAAKFEALRGMEDILPGEIEKWQWLEEKARIFFEASGYKEIRTPILETTDLFKRSVGEASDIVHKEMFSFQDRGERDITLRPEMTASVARCVLEKGLLSQAKSLRFYYSGPMFRAERPQAGRKRQFHQIGLELINESGLSADFESASLLYRFLIYVGVKNPQLRINDLGSLENQKHTAEELRRYFSAEKSRLCPDCHWRLEKNVLRILDCKVESCQPVLKNAPWEKIAPLSPEFEKLAEQLKSHHIPFEIRRRLVRGLDYYNGLVFEATAEGLGAQDALAGGGRYDRLYSDLGGNPTPCTGFSIGMERLLQTLEKTNSFTGQKVASHRVYLAPLDSHCEILAACQKQALFLREQGIRVETLPHENSLSKHLKKANQLGVRFVAILGSAEWEKRKWTVKDMNEKKQEEVEIDGLASHLRGALSL